MSGKSIQRRNSLKRLLSNQLRKEISSGSYDVGATLDSERELCEKHGVSRTTVHGAIEILEQEGLVKRHARRGTVVTAAGVTTKTGPSLASAATAPIYLYIRWSLSRNTTAATAGFGRGCSELGAEAHICDVHESREALLESLNHVPAGTNGVIFEPFDSVEECQAIESLIKRSVTVVGVNRFLPHAGVHTVNSDHFSIGYLSTDHLFRRWRRPVYHIGSLETVSAQRMAGWQEAMIAHGHDRYQQFFLEDKSDPSEQLYRGRSYDPSVFGQVAGEEIFSRREPVAGGYSIFAVNDWVARGVYRAAEKHGLEIGSDVAIVGTANYPFSASMSPPLSTTESIMNETYAAVKLLWRVQQEPPSRPVRQVIPVRLIERESSLGVGRPSVVAESVLGR
jgi:LacI family transcriptional regulator